MLGTPSLPHGDGGEGACSGHQDQRCRHPRPASDDRRSRECSSSAAAASPSIHCLPVLRQPTLLAVLVLARECCGGTVEDAGGFWLLDRLCASNSEISRLRSELSLN
ncbi:hypothetical protein Taro_007057 [Colocasia esculenta]|uniref:Uncharacterized protein n=1 Tax=Colocasia esculenta TaxID=4460 RepID=A0A843TYP4_COLES|nr:hypothetical protein [Colocasia esculenta]